MIYLENLKNSQTQPINIPKGNKTFQIKTHSNNELWLLAQSHDISNNLIVGNIINTPPSIKPYNKGDKLLFHIDHIFDINIIK